MVDEIEEAEEDLSEEKENSPKKMKLEKSSFFPNSTQITVDSIFHYQNFDGTFDNKVIFDSLKISDENYGAFAQKLFTVGPIFEIYFICSNLFGIQNE